MMGQCEFNNCSKGGLLYECKSEAVFRGVCAEHMTTLERAAWDLVQFIENSNIAFTSGCVCHKCEQLRRKVAAVKDRNKLTFNTDPEKILKGMKANAHALDEHIKSLESAKYPTQEMLQSEVAIREPIASKDQQ